jgi:hypothetical protein
MRSGRRAGWLLARRTRAAHRQRRAAGKASRRFHVLPGTIETFYHAPWSDLPVCGSKFNGFRAGNAMRKVILAIVVTGGALAPGSLGGCARRRGRRHRIAAPI